MPGIKYPDRKVAAPQIGIINRTAAILSRLASDLGFSPTARSRYELLVLPAWVLPMMIRHPNPWMTTFWRESGCVPTRRLNWLRSIDIQVYGYRHRFI